MGGQRPGRILSEIPAPLSPAGRGNERAPRSGRRLLRHLVGCGARGGRIFRARPLLSRAVVRPLRHRGGNLFAGTVGTCRHQKLPYAEPRTLRLGNGGLLHRPHATEAGVAPLSHGGDCRISDRLLHRNPLHRLSADSGADSGGAPFRPEDETLDSPGRSGGGGGNPLRRDGALSLARLRGAVAERLLSHRRVERLRALLHPQQSAHLRAGIFPLGRRAARRLRPALFPVPVATAPLLAGLDCADLRALSHVLLGAGRGRHRRDAVSGAADSGGASARAALASTGGAPSAGTAARRAHPPRRRRGAVHLGDRRLGKTVRKESGCGFPASGPSGGAP